MLCTFELEGSRSAAGIAGLRGRSDAEECGRVSMLALGGVLKSRRSAPLSDDAGGGRDRWRRRWSLVQD